MRVRTRKRKDRKIFSATAKKSQAINVKPVLMRGGIRL